MSVVWRRRTDPRNDPREEVPVEPLGAALGELLVEECESFLTGSYVEQCETNCKPVPAWAWMNLLAHGTDAELRAAATNRPADDEGRQALAFVAGELVDLIDDGRVDLETFQREVLMPLELDVIACPATTGWTANQLVSGLLRALPSKTSHRS